MAKFTKKWQKDFEKRYSDAMKTLSDLELEFMTMEATNPDEWTIKYTSPKVDTVEFGRLDSFYVDLSNDDDESKGQVPSVSIKLCTAVGNFEFMTVDLEQLIQIRNRLMEAIDEFKRPLKPVKEVVDYDLDDCGDEEDDEYHEFTIKAEQPLTQSWTYTVTARSACEAIKMIEEDPWQEGVVNNDDNDYYDYGEIEYESI